MPQCPPDEGHWEEDGDRGGGLGHQPEMEGGGKGEVRGDIAGIEKPSLPQPSFFFRRGNKAEGSEDHSSSSSPGPMLSKKVPSRTNNIDGEGSGKLTPTRPNEPLIRAFHPFHVLFRSPFSLCVGTP